MPNPVGPRLPAYNPTTPNASAAKTQKDGSKTHDYIDVHGNNVFDWEGPDGTQVHKVYGQNGVITTSSGKKGQPGSLWA